MLNLEIKVRCPDVHTLDNVAARAGTIGAVYIESVRQKDTYFVTPHGRLKLREWGPHEIGARKSPKGQGRVVDQGQERVTRRSGAALVAYARPDISGPRFSEFHTAPISDAVSVQQALTSVLEVYAVVDKQRSVYLYRATRIHLDNVTGLGAFVELETVLGDSYGDADRIDAQAEHNQVILDLGLDEFESVPNSYGDLIWAASTPWLSDDG